MKPVWAQLFTGSKMLTFQLKASVHAAELPSSEMSFGCGQRGLGAPGYTTFRNFRIGAGGGQEALRGDQVRRKYPVIQHLHSESACVTHLLQASDAADVVRLCRGVKGFSCLGHQTKSKMRQIRLNPGGSRHFKADDSCPSRLSYAKVWIWKWQEKELAYKCKKLTQFYKLFHFMLFFLLSLEYTQIVSRWQCCTKTTTDIQEWHSWKLPCFSNLSGILNVF